VPVPPRAWPAILLGVAPHLVVIGVGASTDVTFVALEGAVCAIPFALYGPAELVIVPAALVLAGLGWAVRRIRPWPLWFALGTLAGATAVLLTAAATAAKYASV
jgi:hypothetical protein